MEIYKVTNLVNGKCYIGKTVYNLEHRKKQHLNARYRRKYAFYNALNKYGLSNFKWETIDCCDSEDKLNELEMFYIKEFNTLAPNGYNLSLGGDGQSGYRHTEESKLKMSIARKGVPRKPHSQSTKKKLSESMMGERNPMFGKVPGNAKKVLCVETNIVYDNMKVAQEMTGIHKANISSVCRGIRKHAGGFTWKFIDNDMTIPSQGPQGTGVTTIETITSNS